LGLGVTIGPFCVIHDNVEVGEGTFIDSHSILGSPTAGYYADPAAYDGAPCHIGPGSIVRSHSVIYAGVEIGEGFDGGHRVTIREGSSIGTGVRIGTLCDLQGNLSIGDHCRLLAEVHVSQLSTIEECVWIFPYVVFTNDPHPPSDTCTTGATVRKFAVIATHAMIFPGVEIGEGALIGAMTLVRRDVPAHSVVVGIPGKVVGPTTDVVCHDGRLEQVYPWWTHFRRGFPEGVLPESGSDG